MSESAKVKTITIISGKGGTGKTSLAASFGVLASPVVIADCDVDAANLHLLLSPEVQETNDFYAMPIARIIQDQCVGCGTCFDVCRYDAIRFLDGDEPKYEIDPLACEACLLCREFCPEDAVETVDRIAGQWYLSKARTGPMVHAHLGIAQDNSGKLVTEVRKAAAKTAEENGIELVLVDGPPGIGCAVMASLTGSDLVVAVTEATQSGLSDLIRVHELCDHFDIPINVIINKSDLNKDVTEEIHNWAQRKGAPVIGELPYDTDFAQAMIDAKTIVEYAPDGVGAQVREMWNNIKKMKI